MGGKLNPSGDPNDEGNAEFEQSRKKANDALNDLKVEGRKGGQTAHLTERLIELKTGKKWDETSIQDLPSFTAGMKAKRSKEWKSWQVTVISRFAAWAVGKALKTVLDVSPEIAEKYFASLADGSKTDKTMKDIKVVFVKVFDKALPQGVKNPFRDVVLETDADGAGDMEHRIPLTHEEENTLLAVARKTDPFTYQLLVAALSTGLRRGDVCRLKWSSVDFRGNVLNVRTSKTGATVCLPIMPTLREVLDAQLATKEDKAVYVFPDARRMITANPDGITYRVKRAFALMFSEITKNEPQEPQDKPEPVNLKDVLPEVLEAVQRAKMRDSRRLKMIDVLKLYGKGKKYREIKEIWKICHDTISDLLHEAQDISGFNFMPENKGGESIRRTIKHTTRKTRTVGTRSASKYDFHSLRTTFCTRAIAGGFSVDMLRALTGHGTVDTVLKHYFKPSGSDYRGELEKVMPTSLLGSNVKAIESDVSRLAAQLQNLSKADKAQLKKMLNTKGLK
jgi:integrase